MEAYQDIISILTLTLGAAWASGINLYATLAILGFAGSSGQIQLPPDLEILASPWVIGAASLMYVVEFVADKIPGVDSAWDSLHTFIRIPAGAMLASGAVGDVGMGMEIASAILGGGMATATHATKAGSRVLINTSPEPFSNWGASISEDVAVFAGLWAALNHPLIFLGILIVSIILIVWLLPKIWGAIKSIFAFLFGGKTDETETKNDNPITQQLEALERLQNLREKGVIDEAEFQIEKQKLLNS